MKLASLATAVITPKPDKDSSFARSGIEVRVAGADDDTELYLGTWDLFKGVWARLTVDEVRTLAAFLNEWAGPEPEPWEPKVGDEVILDTIAASPTEHWNGARAVIIEELSYIFVFKVLGLDGDVKGKWLPATREEIRKAE